MCLASEVLWVGKEDPSTPGGKTQPGKVEMFFYKQPANSNVLWFEQVLDSLPQSEEASWRYGRRKWIVWKLPEAWALNNPCFITLTFSLAENLSFLFSFIRLHSKHMRKHEENERYGLRPIASWLLQKQSFKDHVRKEAVLIELHHQTAFLHFFGLLL